jgi:hypothetical protein
MLTAVDGHNDRLYASPTISLMDREVGTAGWDGMSMFPCVCR